MRFGGQAKFRASPKSEFFNSIGPLRTVLETLGEASSLVELRV
jgi:hypothetical protein